MPVAFSAQDTWFWRRTLSQLSHPAQSTLRLALRLRSGIQIFVKTPTGKMELPPLNSPDEKSEQEEEEVEKEKAEKEEEEGDKSPEEGKGKNKGLEGKAKNEEGLKGKGLEGKGKNKGLDDMGKGSGDMGKGSGKDKGGKSKDAEREARAWAAYCARVPAFKGRRPRFEPY